MSTPVLEILVVRADRIGDVILSTPVIEVLKNHYPQSRLTLMVREPIVPLVRGIPGVDDVMVYDPTGRHAGLGGLFNLVSDVRGRGFRIAIMLQSQWKIAAALYGAGVRYRVGPLSKIHSYLFYNRGVRQRRSHVEMHEADYNLQLLRRLGVRVGSRAYSSQVALSDGAREKARAWLVAQGATPGESSLIAVHPGMGGSALNWPESHFVELIRALSKEGKQVLVTGGPTDAEGMSRIRTALEAAPMPPATRPIFFLADTVTSIDLLVGIYSHVSVVVAPSTGPLHLAVALDKPVIAFYPPIRVQSAIRWGPYRKDDSKSSVLVPEVYCGQDFECLGNKCNYFPCMKSISVTQALGEVRRHLQRKVP